MHLDRRALTAAFPFLVRLLFPRFTQQAVEDILQLIHDNEQLERRVADAEQRAADAEQRAADAEQRAAHLWAYLRSLRLR